MPLGPLTDSMLLKTDKSMVGPAFQISYKTILLHDGQEGGGSYKISTTRRKYQRARFGVGRTVKIIILLCQPAAATPRD